MDWTGGVRRRFAAGKNNPLLQKQKAHFAKVRGALQHTPNSHRTFQPDFIRAHEGKRQRPSTQRDTTSRDTHRHDRQTDTSHHPQQDSKCTQRTASSHQNLHPDEKSPSFVFISSGSPASSAPSTRTHHRNKRTAPRHSSARPPSALTEEDELLLANRRRLLARTDWLGLAAARPIQMKFSSARDKDRIGKRRKVEKTGNRAKPAGRRLLTPLFDERFPQRDVFMSGALPADDIRIRIGTDALASQTQRSRRSHTPAHTSIRQPSTEFGPLSEESMLLGADGDSSEAWKAVEDAFVEQHGAAQAPSMMAMAGSQVHTVDAQETHLPSRQPSEASEARVLDLEHPDTAAVTPAIPELVASQHVESMPGHNYGMRTVSTGIPTDARPGHRINPTSAMHHLGYHYNEEPADGRHDAGGHARSPGSSVNNLDLGDKNDDDDTWRQLLRIQHYTSSHASMAALRSSSQHNTVSGSSHRPLMGQYHLRAYEDMPELSTPREVGTLGATIVEPSADGMEQPASPYSPSASLQQIVRLAEQPAQRRLQTALEDSDENALWRDFVIGSEEDESDSSLQLGQALSQGLVKDDEEPATLAASSLAVSGLGTSDKATLGDTLFVSDNTPSSMQQPLRKHNAQPKRDSFLQSKTAMAAVQGRLEDLIRPR
ncbi:hypothetical protein LTR85_011658 [Meristemomyces frigidus]|nr:hypothetical protein LTR85_011658 [Meristemomyces frigidus]